MAVVALPGGDTHRPLVVRHTGDLLVAVERDQCGRADGDRLRAEGEALGDIPSVADSAGDDEIDVVRQPHVLERTTRFGDGCEERDPGLLRGNVRAGTRA